MIACPDRRRLWQVAVGCLRTRPLRIELLLAAKSTHSHTTKPPSNSLNKIRAAGSGERYAVRPLVRFSDCCDGCRSSPDAVGAALWPDVRRARLQFDL